MSDATARARPRLLWRLAPVALALLGLAIVQHLYGTQPVALLLQIPSNMDDGQPGIDVRLTRPNGALVIRVEEHARSASGHTIVIHTRLPRGTFKVEGVLDKSGQRLCQTVPYDGEDSIEVLLSPC